MNGQHRQIQGVCIHHDLGAIGAAVNESVLRYRLKMLKDMGCDAIRTSHNLPSSLLPKLCDEMGLMLMIEPFDEWDTPKCENGFHRFSHHKQKDRSKIWYGISVTMLRLFCGG